MRLWSVRMPSRGLSDLFLVSEDESCLFIDESLTCPSWRRPLEDFSFFDKDVTYITKTGNIVIKEAEIFQT